ncbi:hypothetical protein D7L51_13925 [Enterococcus faecalis]|nr:hypothetical protein [Enterococcus faecalis]
MIDYRNECLLFSSYQTCSPNVELIINRCHIVKHMNHAFIDLRIREMNKLHKVG